VRIVTAELIRGSLPDRMDAAADVLVEATRRYVANMRLDGPEYSDWRPVNLRSIAAMWRLEDEARETLCNELAEVMREAGAGNPAFSLRSVADLLLTIYDITPKVQPTVITAGGTQ
jgi:hypothetical protein